MPKLRIIPTLLYKRGRLVKGKHFEAYRDVGNPVTIAKNYNTQKVDELLFLDIDSEGRDREAFISVLEAVASECFVPLTVGGGIRSLEDIHHFLRHGADKVSLNSAAFRDPDLIRTAAERFGSQCVVVSIDYRRNPQGKRIVWIDSGRTETGVELMAHVKACCDAGAGEILLTSMDHEGAMGGFDLETIRDAAQMSRVPIIASGGAGKLKDISDVFEMTTAEAVAVGSLFNFTDQSPIKTRFYLYNQGINVRK